MNTQNKEQNKKYLKYSIIVHIILLVIIIVGVIAFALLQGLDIEKICPYRSIFGFYCPGCGGSRAVLLLLEGKIIKSIAHHPVPAYFLGIWLYSYIGTIKTFIKRDGVYYMQPKPWMAIVFAVLTFVFFVGRLIIDLVWGINY